MQKDELLKLAELVDACAEDAKRPIIFQSKGYDYIDTPPSAATVSLANGLEAVAAALRALAGGE